MEEKKETLSDLVLEANQLISIIVDSGDESIEMEKQLDLIHDKLATKSNAYGFAIKKIQAETKFYKEQAQGLREVAKRLETNVEYMKERIKGAMSALGMIKIGPFTLYRMAPALEIDEEAVPEEYMKTTIVKTPDKDKIEEALDDAIDLPFARHRVVEALKITVPKQER